MAYFSRLILIFLLALSAQQSFAAIEIGGKQYVVVPSLFRTDGNSSTDNESRLASCQTRVDTGGCVASLEGGDPYYGTANATGCRATCGGWTTTFPQSLVCPSDASFMQDPTDSNKWKCLKEITIPECGPNQELDPETNTCVCKTGPAGAFAVSGDTFIGCNDNCRIVLISGSYSEQTNKTYGNWRQTGDSCTPSPDAPGVDSPDSPGGQDAGKCPTGQCPGTFNGQFMCVPCKGKEASDSSSSENTTETPNGASAPSGSASQSQSGSKSTECDGGVCVTKETVVVTNPDGSTTENEKETTESFSEFCSKNPRAAICKAADDSSWGGACSGGFQCKGDAVQCAQAQASWKSACAADVSGMTEQINTGTAAMAAGAASGLGIPGGSEAFDLGSRLSEVPLFGGSGGCPSDVSVNVGGTSYTIAFSAMCPQLQVLGVALMAFAYLVAGFIVFRGDRS